MHWEVLQVNMNDYQADLRVNKHHLHRTTIFGEEGHHANKAFYSLPSPPPPSPIPFIDAMFLCFVDRNVGVSVYHPYISLTSVYYLV